MLIPFGGAAPEVFSVLVALSISRFPGLRRRGRQAPPAVRTSPAHKAVRTGLWTHPRTSHGMPSSSRRGCAGQRACAQRQSRSCPVPPGPGLAPLRGDSAEGDVGTGDAHALPLRATRRITAERACGGRLAVAPRTGRAGPAHRAPRDLNSATHRCPRALRPASGATIGGRRPPEGTPHAPQTAPATDGRERRAPSLGLTPRRAPSGSGPSADADAQHRAAPRRRGTVPPPRQCRRASEGTL